MKSHEIPICWVRKTSIFAVRPFSSWAQGHIELQLGPFVRVHLSKAMAMAIEIVDLPTSKLTVYYGLLWKMAHL